MEQPNTDMMQMETGFKTRPTFLTVLCILSFVGIGLIMFSGLINLLTNSGSTVLRLFQNSESPFGTIIENPDEFVSTTFIVNLVGFFAALVCLTGVVMMWKLKRTGFYIYAVGEIVPPIVSLALSGRAGYGNSLFASLFVVGLIISFLFAIAFIIMYAVNLKHMR
jgi:hypothetical protein